MKKFSGVHHVALICAIWALPTTAAAAQEPIEFPLSLGIAFNGYIESSEPELEGATAGGTLVFTARFHPRLSIYVEGGRARFYADDQEGHRDFYFGGLLGFHTTPTEDGIVLLAGPTLLHSERHKFFGDLSTNQFAVTLGAEYVWIVANRAVLAASWRSDISSGITTHRPGFSVRVRF